MKEKESKFNMYKESIEKIEYNQLHGDAYWGYLTLNETEAEYIKVEQLIKNDMDLNIEEKNFLISQINDKRSKMSEIDKQVQNKIKEENELTDTAIKNAKERYQKLGILKKIKLNLLKQDPKNVEFEFLNDDEINNMYSRKR